MEPEDLGLLGAQLTSHPDRLSLEAYRAKADQEAISTSLSLTHQNISAAARAQDAATDIASITADRGIVTRPGRFTIEPSFSHAHSNATRVAIEGYTVIPALLIKPLSALSTIPGFPVDLQPVAVLKQPVASVPLQKVSWHQKSVT